MCGWIKDAASIVTTIGSVAMPVVSALQSSSGTSTATTSSVTKVDKTAAAESAAEDRRRFLALQGKGSTIRTPANLGPITEEAVKYKGLLGGV